MTKGSGGFGNRLSRCVRAPLRALSRARDFYVRSMTDCAGRMHYGTAAAPLSFPPVGNMSRSSSSNGRLSSSDEDLIELIRASSKSRLRAAAAAEGSVQRSQSVAAVRIDEDAPYESSGEVKIGGSLIFPRSRSCAVGGNTTRSAITWKYK
ncbi:hypothetical protein HPP92_019123 [Vanilla planifolia]|uniref:Uncharacterized protein n=1 Tax=Vanilla planifolia TaxID=51239 RepID=A0A835Q3J3_VANPL|nr:hypothetical protein HPP92_019629 [Vanilla planifolia]KAG0464959.1 hypothetical protein HPP92_019123 [Vanilla planifolia]